MVVSVMTMATAVFIPGCRNSSVHAAQATPDPSDVNTAAAQGACPTGQVLMSDGSCQAADQAAPPPAAGSQPQASSETAAQPTYAPETGSSPQQEQPQYSSPQAQEQSQDQYGGQNENSDVYDQQNPYDDQTYQQDAYNDGYQQGYEAAIQANQPPPPLPVYAQPLCPGPGYMWNPGYWYWGPGGYYWVPGVWVLAPYTGALWTPGWWGFFGGFYRWHHGYWGPHIGFYGGIPYGYGYTGEGFHGGYWNHDRFMYNRSVTNINVTKITNVYNVKVVNVHNTRV
ncbi:MAG TPA: hypothetical protein VF126_18320, partial [Acidobacteriaceae bacterium]